MADDKKEEERKLAGFDPFDEAEIRGIGKWERMRDNAYKERLKRHTADVAYKLAVLSVRDRIRDERIKELRAFIEVNAPGIDDRIIKKAIRESDWGEIRKLLSIPSKTGGFRIDKGKANEVLSRIFEIRKMEEQKAALHRIGKKLEDIENRKKELLEKPGFDIETQKRQELGEKDFLKKKGKLTEEQYKKQTGEIGEFYKDVFERKKKIETKKSEEEIFVPGTAAAAGKKNAEYYEAIEKLKQDIIDQYGYLEPDAFRRGEERIRAEAFGDVKEINKRILERQEELARTRGKNQKELLKKEIEELKKQRESAYKKGGERTIKESMAGGPTYKFFEKTGGLVKKGLFMAAIIGIGAVISAALGNMWFFFGFLSLGLYFLFPSPNEYEHAPMDTSLWGMGNFRNLNPFGNYKAHSSWAILKSLTKVSAIICFAYAFKSMGDIFNTFFIITCLAGYFSLKVTYKNSGEFLESFLRFAVLGFYFIPFIVFANIFNSYVLAFIAMAFFAIPPMPDAGEMKSLPQAIQEAGSGRTAYYEMIDKFVFLGLMIFALIGSGSLGTNTGFFSFLNVGWQLSGTLSATFIYFWIVSAIGGFFSPPQERPLTGALFLGAATIIYAIGPGSQDVGSALLGQWWPSVNNAVTTISVPINNMFGTLGKTFGDAFLLLTNPVGYATQLMNGSYSNNPVGDTGAYGVELSGFDVSPVFIEQPFMITANIKNNGAVPAEDVRIALTSGLKAPERQTSLGTPSIAATRTLTQPIKISQLNMADSCNNKPEDASKDTQCIQYFDGKFVQQNVWQAVFSSKGIACDVSIAYELRKKSIPINITLTYKYQSDSKVPIEFISQAEWDRLAKLGTLDTKLAFVKSEYSTAPAKFPIGTPGLKNPILETQDFHIALNLMSDQNGGKIASLQSISLNYPDDFELADDKCNPGGFTESPVSEGVNTITWTWDSSSNVKSGDQIFFCHFQALKPSANEPSKLGDSPTKTYVVTAHANYTYSNSQQKLVNVLFGSWCCTGEAGVCLSDQKCCPEDKVSGKGICTPKTQNCQGGTSGTPASGCCQAQNDVQSFCMNANSAPDCLVLEEATFMAGKACNQNTGKCE